MRSDTLIHPHPELITHRSHTNRSPGNVDDDKEIDEIYTLLTENYVEDDDAGHRFQREKEIFAEHQCKPKPSR